ncbi:MAG: sugar ABC transporter permease [Treponema sp.]|nr:sugar ABC transporter permease [Treponema sp.]
MKKQKLSKQLRIDLTGYAFILPNVIGMVCFTLLPIIFSLIISFTNWDFTKGIGNWKFIGLQNFIRIWTDDWFTAAIKNSLLYAFITVPLSLAISLVLAVIIDRACHAKTALRLAMFMPYISNVVAISIVWVMMFSPWGPFTRFIQFLGVKNPPQWLADYTWALPSIMFMAVWSGLGYNIMIYTASIQGLPQELYEAADIDGASEARKFFSLTIPLLSPTIFFLVVTGFIGAFQVFGQVQVMTNGGPGTSTSVLVFYIFRSAFTFYKMGYAAAMSWILFAVLFIVTLIQWKGQEKWVGY